jgi:tetratricopeptide (TPR) repeat protein
MIGVINIIDVGDHGWAIEDYTHEIEKNSRNAAAYNNRGVLYYNKEEYNQALADFKEAIKISKNSEIGDYNCGLAYFSSQLYDQAITNLSNAIKIFKEITANSQVVLPLLTAAYYYRGFAHFNKRNYEQAIEDLLEAEHLCPNDQEIMQVFKDAQKERYTK